MRSVTVFGFNEVRFNPSGMGPPEHRHTGELGAVVDQNRQRFAVVVNQLVQKSGDSEAGDRVIDENAAAFTGTVIDHGQQTKTAPV